MLRTKAFVITASLLCAALWHPDDSLAALTPDSVEHARSALLFADRHDWNNALLHAKHTNDPSMVALVTLQYLLDTESGASFNEYINFLEAHPDWPDQKKLRLRAELSLKNENITDHDLMAWFNDSIPITGIGKMALVAAYQRNKMATQDKITYLVRDAWRNGDFDEDQEQQIQSTYGKLLTADDYIGRVDRLLWDGKTTPAKRILSRVPSAQNKLYTARIALIEDSKQAPAKVSAVPASLKNDPGLIYDRMQFRVRHDDSKGVREMLYAAPAHVPYPEKWWRAREYQVHKALDDDDYTTAKKLLANHGQVEGQSLADAMWLRGWLMCQFTKQPKDAYHVFYEMFGMVNYPVSKARAAYWAARSAEKAGDNDAAKSWYTTASAYPTTFYGQLASYKLNGSAPLRIPAPPVITAEDQKHFNSGSLASAIRLCIELGEIDRASRFINYMAENSDSEGKARLAAEVGKKYGYAYLGVRAAKKALQKNIVLVDAGYPTPKTPAGIAIERPLALAIMRQESEYDPHARSTSGAMGLMQIMPRTAKDIAKKEGLRFAPDELYDQQYNMTLGTKYLGRMVDSYDGSYVMAIAAYNAGPGNVRNWVKEFGTPGNQVDNAVDWIEKIPYYETRNYVQRVMENLQVYRHIEAKKNTPTLEIAKDLMR